MTLLNPIAYASAAVIAIFTLTSAVVEAATVCNGFSSLCDRQFSNVTYIGTHNSYAIGRGTSNVAANQEQSITAQLQSGVRMLQAQAHQSTNATVTGAGIDLCHTSCDFLQGGAIEYWLQQIKEWTDANPNEVLSLLIVNSDDLPASQFAQAFQSTGMAAKMFQPNSTITTSSGGVQRYSWPTLGNLIDAGTPVLAWLDNSADLSSVPYLMAEFDSMWENPYDQLSAPFNCSVDRIGAGLDSSNLMLLANHFLYTGLESLLIYPNVEAIYTTNSEASVLQTITTCAAEHQTDPTFILVDYYNLPENDVFAAAAQLNAVSFTNTTSTSTTSSTGSGGTSGNGSSAAVGDYATRISLSSLFTVFSVLALAMSM